MTPITCETTNYGAVGRTINSVTFQSLSPRNFFFFKTQKKFESFNVAFCTSVQGLCAFEDNIFLQDLYSR